LNAEIIELLREDKIEESEKKIIFAKEIANSED
jgi:hypothetical protein